MKLALLIAIAAIAQSAAAVDVYKCQDSAGRIEFRDRPCDPGHKAQNVDVTPNTIGTLTLEEVRAKSAEFKARQQARREAESKADAAADAAQERTWQRQRALQDAVDLQQAIRDSGHNAPAQYYHGYYFGQQHRPRGSPRPLPKLTGIATPPPPLKAPRMPMPPPKPPAGL